MNLEKEHEVDWFTIDLEEFDRAYREAVAAWDKSCYIEEKMQECYERRCNHAPLKKDGTPDKRYRCEDEEFEYGNVINEINCYSFEYGALWKFFKRIGLPLEKGAGMSASRMADKA